MTNIFKDKTPSGSLQEFPTMAEQVHQTSMRSRDARLPGERKNYQAGVESVQRPRFGKDM